MHSISPALCHNIDRGSCISSEFGHEIGDDLQLLNGVHRQDGRWRTEHTGLVNGRIIAIAVIHVRTIKEKVVRATAGAVHRKNSK